MTDGPISHRGACNKVATWMMKRAWCDFAVVEVAGRATAKLPPFTGDIEAPKYLPFDATHTREQMREQDKLNVAERKRHRKSVAAAHKKHARAHPECGGGQLDVLAFMTVEREEDRVKRPPPRIAVCEVKVQLGDLRSDLKEGKMLRYEPQATHVYLAVTAEATGIPLREQSRLLERLGGLGLPSHWGVLYVDHYQVTQVRGPRKYALACEPTKELRRSLLRGSAISLAWRAFR